MEIRKEGAQSLRMKTRNAELELKGATVILRLAAACSKTALASVKARQTKLPKLVLQRAKKRISEQALN